VAIWHPHFPGDGIAETFAEIKGMFAVEARGRQLF
jgi:hypothetical protein